MISIPKVRQEELNHCFSIIVIEGRKRGLLGIKNKKEGTTADIDINKNESSVSEDKLRNIVQTAIKEDRYLKRYIDGKVYVQIMGFYGDNIEHISNVEFSYENGNVI